MVRDSDVILEGGCRKLWHHGRSAKPFGVISGSQTTHSPIDRQSIEAGPKCWCADHGLIIRAQRGEDFYRPLVIASLFSQFGACRGDDIHIGGSAMTMI